MIIDSNIKMDPRFNILIQKHKEINKLKDEIFELSKDLFSKVTKEIFDKYPRIESFSWTQYTSYTKGVFVANVCDIKINGELVDQSDWINPDTIIGQGTWNKEKKIFENMKIVPNVKYDSVMSDASNEIVNFLSYFDDDFYLDQFGDHAEIVITKQGVNIHEYDHE